LGLTFKRILSDLQSPPQCARTNDAASYRFRLLRGPATQTVRSQRTDIAHASRPELGRHVATRCLSIVRDRRECVASSDIATLSITDEIRAPAPAMAAGSQEGNLSAIKEADKVLSRHAKQVSSFLAAELMISRDNLDGSTVSDDAAPAQRRSIFATGLRRSL
jgi:hypothetical protein